MFIQHHQVTVYKRCKIEYMISKKYKFESNTPSSQLVYGHNIQTWAMVVAQLAERLPAIPEVRGSNPVIGKI